jgi:hypothetical protein
MQFSALLRNVLGIGRDAACLVLAWKSLTRLRGHYEKKTVVLTSQVLKAARIEAYEW